MNARDWQDKEDRREAARMYGGIGIDIPIRTEEEAAEYTAEIMAGTPRCAICGRWYLPEDDSPLCNNCLAYENQKGRDCRDERDQAHAATNGTL